MPTATPEIERDIVDLVGFSNQAVKLAAAAQTAMEKQAADCKALIPACVAALVKHERIDPSEAEKCAKVLENPVQVLQLLTKLAEHRNTAEKQSLGTPIDSEKTAAAGGTSRRGGLSEADRRLWVGLGLVPPSE
jgi:hypothetical protein